MQPACSVVVPVPSALSSPPWLSSRSWPAFGRCYCQLPSQKYRKHYHHIRIPPLGSGCHPSCRFLEWGVSLLENNIHAKAQTRRKKPATVARGPRRICFALWWFIWTSSLGNLRVACADFLSVPRCMTWSDDTSGPKIAPQIGSLRKFTRSFPHLFYSMYRADTPELKGSISSFIICRPIEHRHSKICWKKQNKIKANIFSIDWYKETNRHDQSHTQIQPKRKEIMN